MEAESPRAGPVELSERIVFIDVLRGMALFGILAANMRAFVAPLDCYEHIGVLFPGRADVIAQWFIDAFIQGKFISIFSFLFGMGFAIQMSRAEARGARFLSFYPRRLLALALFGLIHGILIWAGDILLTYAISGTILLVFRNRTQKTLLAWTAGLFVLPFVGSTVFGILYFSRFHRPWMDRKAPDLAKLHAVIQIYAHGTVRQILAQNWVEWKHSLPLLFFSIYATGLFLLGMWVWRAGIVQKLEDYAPLFRRVFLWCMPIGLIINAYVATVKAILPPERPTVWGLAAGTVWLLGSHILSAGYISGLALLFFQKDWRARLLPFAAVGRTALTNYLMQSVVCTLFFYNYTTGLYGRIGPALALVPTVLLFPVQVALSNGWLRRFRFGPMEWLWRGMTYGALPPMRAAARATPAEADKPDNSGEVSPGTL